MPSSAMHTMIPANRTARPEVFTALMMEDSTSRPGHEALAVPRHDEEGVVDADTEPDQEHQLGGDGGHAEAVTEDADDTDGGAEGEEGRDDRQEGGEDRPEDQQAGRSAPAGRRVPCC